MPSMNELVAIKERAEAQFRVRPASPESMSGTRRSAANAPGRSRSGFTRTRLTPSRTSRSVAPLEIEGVVTDVLQRRYELQILTCSR